jgi:ubiquinone/menaquinone biosynthesis C-methylase UbiE
MKKGKAKPLRLQNREGMVTESAELEGLFEKPATTCPLCDGATLELRLETPDLLQNKPGQFRLSRCDACGHIFQNPMLTDAGLAHYYQDFYTGHYGDGVKARLAAQTDRYQARAAVLEGLHQPERWLDVGTGYGHFCLEALKRWPEVEMHGLDQADAIQDALSQGWISHAWRLNFPDLQVEPEETYDVVSMFHYLEHCRDPRAQLAAAARAMKPGGFVIIECPDPESKLGKILGRYWLSWFQPQHLHFLSTTNLSKVLDQEGFEVVRVQRAETHLPEDFAAAVDLWAGHLAPRADLPWDQASRPAGVLRRWSVALMRAPLTVVASQLDRSLAPYFRSHGWSNTFRMVARRRGA